jgi:hypothetical protein
VSQGIRTEFCCGKPHWEWPIERFEEADRVTLSCYLREDCCQNGRTSGHCLGTFTAENVSVSPVKCIVSHYSPPTFSSLSFIRLQRIKQNTTILPYFIFFPWLYSPWKTLAASHIGGFLNYLDIWQDSSDEWSARRKASTYTGQHNTERRGQTSMLSARFEPTIPTTNGPRPTPRSARPLWPALYFIARGKYTEWC